MEEITYKELQIMFIQFLKKHKAYKNYKHNLLKKQPTWDTSIYPLHNHFIREHIFNDGIGRIISSSFLWSATNEKNYFWMQISNEWKKLSKNLKLKL